MRGEVMGMLMRRLEELYHHPTRALMKASYYEFSRVCGQTFTSDFGGRKYQVLPEASVLSAERNNCIK